MIKKYGPVSLASCANYQEPGLTRALDKCLKSLGGMRSFVGKGDRVLLKPNLLTAKPPESGVCTQPEVLRAVTGLVRKAGGEPFVGDSPAGRPGSFPKVMERSGLAAVARELEMEVVRFDEEPTTISYPGGTVFKRFEVARAVIDADVVITLPRLKTHNLTGITAGVKILFGCVPGMRKMGYHVTAGREGVQRFAEMLVDLAAAISPTLTLMDSIVSMEGNGPSSGVLRKMGIIAASPDPFAMDWVVSELLNVPPMDFPTVSAAERAGLGPGLLKDVKLVGEPLDTLRVDDFALPDAWDPSDRFGSLLSTAARIIAPRPRIRKDSCVNCNTCVEGCPTQALVTGEPVPKFVQKKCIRCYCCAEICPEDAVEIVRAIAG